MRPGERIMTMVVTNGKYAGISKVSNEKVVIAAVAVDQRGSLKKMLVANGSADVADVFVAIV